MGTRGSFPMGKAAAD